MFEKLKRLWTASADDREFQAELEKLREKTPAPLFWLFGKTQSGKTSIVRFLTGAEDAEIGRGFRPCTRFSRLYDFPTADAPLLRFLDTRGLDEPGYAPDDDLKQFNEQAQVIIVTAKVMDHAQASVIEHLRTLRKAAPERPVLLALTCLHEAYPQQQHPMPYPFQSGQDTNKNDERRVGVWTVSATAVPEALLACLEEQCRRFDGLFDRAVPVDLTRADEGFAEPNYGGDQLQSELLALLPHAYRQSLLMLEDAKEELQELYARRAMPYILSYSTMAATAGAMPIPWLDLLVLPGIQARMIYDIAKLYGQPVSGERFLELAGTLGIGMFVRQAVREVVKLVPFAGSVAGSALAFASTFALGKAFCYYYRAVHQGHVPKAEDLKRYYAEQLTLAEQAFKRRSAPPSE
ncbi:MAG: kinase [Gemmatales bacterium]|nr:MAG: kinase [Gemmatales bacterium]